MIILYRSTTSRPVPRGSRCSAAGERSSTASAVPSPSSPSSSRVASTVLASQTSSALSAGGWLDADSESAEVSARLDAEFGAGKSSVIALFRSTTPGADATSAEFQGAIATSVEGLADDAARDRDRRLRRDRRPAVHQHGGRRRVHRHPARRDRRGVGRRRRPDPRGDRAAGRLHLPADRLRPDHQGLGRAVREGPPEGRARLAPGRRARPHPRLRLARRGRDAAARRRPGDPEQPGAHLRRRPAGRDEHLRPQHRDDARARAGDRLLAVHRQPLPRGAAPRPDRRRGGRAGGRPPPARPSRSAASRSPSGCPGCCCSRPRRSARSASPARSSCSARSSSR